MLGSGLRGKIPAARIGPVKLLGGGQGWPLVDMPEARTPAPRFPWWLGLWPGLPGLWLHGSFAGLAAAVGFAALVDFVLATSLVWTEIWEPRATVLWWSGAGLAWAGSLAGWVVSQRRPEAAESDSPAGDLFPLAMTEYLRGNWFEAERLVASQLRTTPQDAEAKLLRVSILRRTGKPVEARRLLDVLSRTEAATKWQFEMARERERILSDEQPRDADDLEQSRQDAA